jgi:SAM-dependent methyltransferase
MSDIQKGAGNAAPAINRYGAMCAEVYVFDKPPGALGDIDYYASHLRPLEGRLLEAGCGSGRLSIPLLEAGLDVEGFDRSPWMLERFEAAARERGLKPRLRQMAFDDFEADGAYGAIFLPVGTFTLIDHYDAAMEALGRFRRALKPHGRLFVDLQPLIQLTATPDHLRSWTTPEGDILRIESRRIELDWMAQRRVSQDHYQRWRDGRLIEQELEVLALRIWGLKEFELALKEVGFDDVTVCGDYRPGRAPRPADRIWCFQARRVA